MGFFFSILFQPEKINFPGEEIKKVYSIPTCLKVRHIIMQLGRDFYKPFFISIYAILRQFTAQLFSVFSF